jgi:hypothetical protein
MKRRNPVVDSVPLMRLVGTHRKNNQGQTAIFLLFARHPVQSKTCLPLAALQVQYLT